MKLTKINSYAISNSSTPLNQSDVQSNIILKQNLFDDNLRISSKSVMNYSNAHINRSSFRANKPIEIPDTSFISPAYLEKIKQFQKELRIKINEQLKTEQDPAKKDALLKLKEVMDNAAALDVELPTSISFCGYPEREEARKIVHAHAVIASGIAAAHA